MHLAQDKAKRGNGSASVLSEGRGQFGGPLLSSRAPPGQLTMKVRADTDTTSRLSREELRQQLLQREAHAGSGTAAMLPSLPQPGKLEGQTRPARASAPAAERDFGAVPWTRALVKGEPPSKENVSALAASTSVSLSPAELGIVRRFDDADVEFRQPPARAKTATSDGQAMQYESDSDDSESDSDSDDEEALRRELAKLRAEKAAKQRLQEEADKARRAREEEMAAASSNPLLAGSFGAGTGAAATGGAGAATGSSSSAASSSSSSSSAGARQPRWDEDVVFRNQMRGAATHPGKRFINDTVRNDFHRRFMAKFVQ